MNNTVLKSDVILPLSNNVTRLQLSQLEIPKEWDQFFNRKEKREFIKNLKRQIKKSRYCTPMTVLKFEDKYIIVDGVLRFLALQDLNLNEADCIILEKFPESSDELKDWIIEYNIKSVPTVDDLIRLLRHYLRNTDVEDGEVNCNRKYGFITETLGRGWGRNNVITVKKTLTLDEKNPKNCLQLSKRLCNKEISFDRANKAIKILENKALNYTLKDEKKAKIISGFLSKNYDQRKAESLIRQYKTKINKGTTNVTFNHKYSSDRYLILPGNSLDTQFPEGTLINGIFTSIPYFNIINYAENGIVPEQLDLGHELEIGREKKREDFVKNIVDVMKIGAENMTEDGVIIINLDDTYKDSVCVGVVALLILEMQNAGFLFIDQMIWEKSNPKPQSNRTSRFTNSYESILIFAKSPEYYYEQLRIFDPTKSATVKRGCSEQGNKGVNTKKSYHISNPYKTMRNFLCDNDIEQILKLNISKERSQDEGLQNGFFGSFPSLFPLPFILSFFPENGVIWDCFGGTGTTGKLALMLNRKVIISELYDKNIAKIYETLERGTSEYDENEYRSLKNDFLSEGNDLRNVA
ncbi:DNA methyltransferase [Chryseobacterium sp. Hurlbut01]|uniref:DNA methyltransferase n=1 Tax=Chryseobacterium sp. Hurlbut01 TaxID=1681828 RepID=UPI00067AAE27|nr:DNA methyltransferase [Chryseobacterium sp. Hurlbut01]KNB62896.1 hypothetical protein AC804_02380 [Chryseobacterium sp. Hurlbut01]